MRLFDAFALAAAFLAFSSLADVGIEPAWDPGRTYEPAPDVETPRLVRDPEDDWADNLVCLITAVMVIAYMVGIPPIVKNLYDTGNLHFKRRELDSRAKGEKNLRKAGFTSIYDIIAQTPACNSCPLDRDVARSASRQDTQQIKQTLQSSIDLRDARSGLLEHSETLQRLYDNTDLRRLVTSPQMLACSREVFQRI